MTWRQVNQPQPLDVSVRPDGAPGQVRVRGRARRVEAVRERWRIDEGWWRAKPISRMYWRLVLDNGHQITLYQDLDDRTWWSQHA